MDCMLLQKGAAGNFTAIKSAPKVWLIWLTNI